MSVFRINLSHSFDYVTSRSALSAPTDAFMQSKGERDNVGYRELEKIKSGDVLLLCRGIQNIHAVAYSVSGCVIADVDAYSPEPVFFPLGFRLVDLKIVKYLWDPVNGHTHFDGAIDGTPFKVGAMGFCFQVHPDQAAMPDFISRINSLLK